MSESVLFLAWIANTVCFVPSVECEQYDAARLVSGFKFESLQPTGFNIQFGVEG